MHTLRPSPPAAGCPRLRRGNAETAKIPGRGAQRSRVGILPCGGGLMPGTDFLCAYSRSDAQRVHYQKHLTERSVFVAFVPWCENSSRNKALCRGGRRHHRERQSSAPPRPRVNKKF